MSDPKGDRLYVNLGASQTRRRLKGFGHGVRKIQTAGRNQAVIIHTATGRHLEELERLFADVGCSRQEGALGEPIENLRNLGPGSGAWLREVGIATAEDLLRVGPVEAFRQVRLQHPTVSPTFLWSLAAAVLDLDWQQLSEEYRRRLLAELG